MRLHRLNISYTGVNKYNNSIIINLVLLLESFFSCLIQLLFNLIKCFPLSLKIGEKKKINKAKFYLKRKKNKLNQLFAKLNQQNKIQQSNFLLLNKQKFIMFTLIYLQHIHNTKPNQIKGSIKSRKFPVNLDIKKLLKLLCLIVFLQLLIIVNKNAHIMFELNNLITLFLFTRINFGAANRLDSLFSLFI